jgi:hypothetical protein
MTELEKLRPHNPRGVYTFMVAKFRRAGHRRDAATR